jgi:hypothetical protein
MPDSNLHAPPRTAELWPVIRDRVTTSRMNTILGGTGRTFVEGDYTGVPWDEALPGGRLVIVPGLRLGGEGGDWVPGEMTRLSFLVRVDFNDYRTPQGTAPYNPTLSMEAAQKDAFDLLHGWTPAPLSRVMVGFPIYLRRPWQPRPLWDEATSTLFMSSEYRVDVAGSP